MRCRFAAASYALLGLVLPGLVLPALILLATDLPALATETVDLDMMNRIRDEGLHRSRVMEILEHLTEDIGPRLSGSPALREANEWTRDEFTRHGLTNAHLEPLDFGRGWSFERCTVQMITPRPMPLWALPQAWTPGTDGPVRGEAVRVKIESEEDLEQYRGELAGKIVFLDDAREVKTDDGEAFERYAEPELEDLGRLEVPSGAPSPWRQRARKRIEISRIRDQFLVDEGAVAAVEISSRDHGIVRVMSGGSHELDGRPVVPTLTMAAEQYDMILRRLEADVPVQLEIDVKARFHDDDRRIFNTVAEIEGGHKRRELVMAGAHLDSWHAGTGATDNAAGCAVVIEAARILKTLGLKPDRTIRFALWAGEEQGLLGSKAYVTEHFATRPAVTDSAQLELPPFLRERTWPIKALPDHRRLSAYFNLDNGTGRIRGIYAQENVAAAAIFEDWLAPFHDLGATEVSTQNTGGTDHLAFDRVGLPGFQFIQDEMDYFSRTHHTNLDVRDHVVRDDLVQASVIMAAFLYDAATREAMMPRKPMPQKPPEEKSEKKPQAEKKEAPQTPAVAASSPRGE